MNWGAERLESSPAGGELGVWADGKSSEPGVCPEVLLHEILHREGSWPLNRLPTAVVMAPSLTEFKERWGDALSPMV